ncbi:MAG: hypothetical protein JXR41_08395 [Bacteroidales bacterium]|nr:hypothetical protein [Bacteroidales bacterium]MBN2763093.1 hypothetical protein [Bacteroidales bacterium]
MKRSILFTLTVSLTISCIFSQRPDLRFIDPLHNLELTNSNVTAIAQDTLGYIWIGTQSGLNRFDGYSLKGYKFVIGDDHSLIDNEISILFLDSHGRLWVGTHRGLCYYVPEYDHFEWISHLTDSSGLSAFEIIDIREDSKGNIYIANTLEIARFQEGDRDFKVLFNIEKGDIASFILDEEDNIWIGVRKEGGLIHLNVTTGHVSEFFHDEKDPHSVSSNSPVSLGLQGDKLWIATYDGGINCYDIKTGIFRRFPVENQYELYARKVYIDRDNRVWTVDVTSLKVYDAENDLLTGYYPLESDPYSIKYACGGIFQDAQGNYWTMHSGEGVCLSVVPKGFQFFDDSPDKYWYVSSNVISAVGIDKNGSLWLGNPSNGIDIFYWNEGRTIRYVNNPDDKYGLGAGAVFCFFTDRNNVMWVGTNMGGLQYYEPATCRFYSTRNNPDDTTSIANNDIRSITEDENGDLWIVVHGKGIDRFDREEGIFYHYNQKNNNLSNDYCYQVMHDQNGNIWVATVWGLSKLEKDKSVFENYYKYDNNINSLTDNTVISLFEDYIGRVWIGTNDGLNMYNADSNNFVRYNNGFESNIINVILGDDKGILWIGTTKGITRLNPVTGECKNFDQHDGILSGEIYPRAGFVNEEYTMFFGGNKGVNLVTPGKIKYNESPPRVLITGLKIFNKEVEGFSEKGILQKDIRYTRSIKLDAKDDVVTFEFLALNMINTFRNQYAYKLEGFDKEWIKAGNKREATYTSLDPKKYVFRVIASNNDGYWNLEGASIEVIVMPPWYKTFIFRFLMALLILSVFAGFYRIRVKQLHKQKAKLEKEVRVRTMELSEKNKLLEEQATELNETNALLEERQQHIEEQAEQLQYQAADLIHANQELKQANTTKDKLFSLIAHDLKDPFNTLLGFTDLLTRDFHKIDDNQKIKIISMIRTSSGRIHELLENMLKWARSQSGNIFVNKKVFRINEAVRAIAPVFQHTLKEKKITLHVDIPDDLEVFADEDMISTVIRNLVNNAIKFTSADGSITLSAEKKGKKVHVSVTDTGIGMPKSVMKTIFNPVKQEIQRGTQGEKGSGLGLMISKEFIEIHEGKISVHSEEGKGSTFSFALPEAPPPDPSPPGGGI